MYIPNSKHNAILRSLGEKDDEEYIYNILTGADIESCTG